MVIKKDLSSTDYDKIKKLNINNYVAYKNNIKLKNIKQLAFLNTNCFIKQPKFVDKFF
jgi:hypothetical protein